MQADPCGLAFSWWGLGKNLVRHEQSRDNARGIRFSAVSRFRRLVIALLDVVEPATGGKKAPEDLADR